VDGASAKRESITHYDVACARPTAVLWLSSVPASPVTITGLTKGDSYVCSGDTFNGMGRTDVDVATFVALAQEVWVAEVVGE